MNTHDPARTQAARAVRPGTDPLGCKSLAALTAAALLACLVFTADAALAADQIFADASPLTRFVDFIVGPFAYAVVIVALVVTVGVLAIGGEFSGFSRRMPIVVVAGGIVILASTVMTNLFGGNRAADLPPGSAAAPIHAPRPAEQAPDRCDNFVGQISAGGAHDVRGRGADRPPKGKMATTSAKAHSTATRPEPMRTEPAAAHHETVASRGIR